MPLLIHLWEPCNHRIEHLDGKPQGPPFSFTSDCPSALIVFVFGFVWVFCWVVPLFSFFATSQNETFLIWFPKVSPWIVASSSSRAEGWRDPSAALEEVS
jgi:hypothetical protein